MKRSFPPTSFVPALALLVACGDNLLPEGDRLPRAATLFVVAHPDDDMIFVQPELLQALGGSTVTVYASTGDLERGLDYTRDLLHATATAYASVLGNNDWDCGYMRVTFPVYHCRHRTTSTSLVSLDIPDGGLYADQSPSLLQLVDGRVAALPLTGDEGGEATLETAIATLASIIIDTQPEKIETLELSGSHGHDHSSHMMTASVLLWALSRTGYTGPVTWHRGYNVKDQAPTFASDDYQSAFDMLAHYEACAYGCAPCGGPCAALDESHELWLQRQYSTQRIASAVGRLSASDGCVHADGTVGTCTDADPVVLTPGGALMQGERCLASTPGRTVTWTDCMAVPEQYWVYDDEGWLWNGQFPDRLDDMSYDHVRCLVVADQRLETRTCGRSLSYRWSFLTARE